MASEGSSRRPGQKAREGYHLLIKPIGPKCNLNCTYCFYSNKNTLFPPDESFRMNDKILETLTREYISSLDIPEITFGWQGGEPTLMGVDFFRRAVALQKKYGNGAAILNTLQTNGLLLNDEWCEFLAKKDFLVGLSLDGPPEIHNRHRTDHSKRPVFSSVVRALRLLQKHGVAFNVLACVTQGSAGHPLEVYNFMKEQGVEFIQFIPVVEKGTEDFARQWGSGDGAPSDPGPDASVTPWSVQPGAWGAFLTQIFDEWARTDVGKVFIMNFEWALCSWRGLPAPTCCYSRTCGRCLVVEHNGDIYSCDHFVYPEYRLGNIMSDPLADTVFSEKQDLFGAAKGSRLPRQCRECDALFACGGGCPKHRFVRSANDGMGINYLCAGHKMFLSHTKRHMKAMARLIDKGIPASRIMDTPLALENEHRFLESMR